jgi:hypothetical protein
MSETVTAPHVLDGAFERVNRAGEHLNDLNTRLEALRQENEKSVVVQFDAEPPHNIQIVVPILAPMRIPILIGEICYNLRTALDYLVFELAKLDSGTSQRGTQFPIEDRKDNFKRRTKTRLKGMNPHHVACIERLQPYAGCDWTKALRDFSNRDEHREFTDIQITATGRAYTSLQEAFSTLTVPIRRTPHPVAGEMDVKLDYTATI